MSLDRRLHSLSRYSINVSRRFAAVLLVAGSTYAAHAAQLTPANQKEPADMCPALSHIVSSGDFKKLRDEPAAKLPGVDPIDDCRANAHSYDCHWRAHWEADGFVNDPLEEIGADLAACFPNVVHDLNTPTRQHFIVKTADRRVSVTASVQGQNELRLRIAR